MVNSPEHAVPPREAHPGYSLVRRKASGKGGLSCWIALPAAPRPGAIPLVAVHGIRRGARMQAEAFAARAAASGRPVIAPRFDAKRWPSYQRVVHRGRADLALLSLMDTLRAEGICTTRRFDLCGYSGGAQFSHRFAMLYPHLIERLAVCSAGWWTFPDNAPFPYGMGEGNAKANAWGPRIATTLARFLALDVVVAVGANDDVGDAITRRGAAIDLQQGTNRKARATRWVESLKAAAQALGLSPRVKLAILPDCGHSFRECLARGRLDELVVPDRPAKEMSGEFPIASLQ